MHIKQILMVILSNQKMNRCFKSQFNSFSIDLSEKRYGLGYLKSNKFSFIADNNIFFVHCLDRLGDIIHIKVVIYFKKSTHLYKNTHHHMNNFLNISFCNGMWLSSKVIVSLSLWWRIILVSMIRIYNLGGLVLLSHISKSKNCLTYFRNNTDAIIQIINKWPINFTTFSRTFIYLLLWQSHTCVSMYSVCMYSSV